MGLSKGSSGATVSLVIDVTQAPYSADRTGVADCFDAIQAAVTAAYAANGGIVWLPAGTYLLNKIAGSCINTPAVTGTSGMVEIRGAGMDATVIKLSPANVPALHGVTPVGGSTFGALKVSNLTVDANDPTGVGVLSGVVANVATTSTVGDTTAFHMRDFHYENLRIINMGPLKTSGTGRRGFNFLLIRTTIGGPVFNQTGFRLRNIIGGVDASGSNTGGGGNTGFFAASFTNIAKNLADVFTVANIGGTFTDDVIIDGFLWKLGTGTPTSTAASSAIQTGGDGVSGRVRIRDAEMWNGGDVAIEIDTPQDALIERCRGVDFFNQPFIAINIGGTGDYKNSKVKFSDCEARWTAAANAINPTQAFYVNLTRPAVVPISDVIFENCRSLDLRTVFPAGSTMFNQFYITGFRRLTMRNIVHRVIGAYTFSANAQTRQYGAVFIQAVGAHSSIDIRGLHMDVEGSVDTGGFTTDSFTFIALRMPVLFDANLRIDGVTMRSNLTILNSAPVRLKRVDFPSGASAIADAFGSDTITSDYLVDAGTRTDLLVSGGKVTSAANHAVEKILTWIEASGNFANGVSGPFCDGSLFAKFTPGPTLTAFKGGVHIKRLDATNRLEIYVYDDGVQSYLCVDKIDAGVRTSLLGAVTNGGAGTVTDIATPASYAAAKGVLLATRITSATNFWCRGFIQGDVITADYFTSAPTNTLSTAGANRTTVTLAGADAIKFGDRGILGRSGFCWAPVDAAALLDDLTANQMHVVAGTVAGVSGRGNNGNGLLDEDRGIHVSLATTGGFRVRGLLRLRDNDLSLLGPASSQLQEIQLATDVNLRQNVLMQGNGWAPGGSQPQAAAITVTASPFTYTNQDGYAELVNIFAGTVSNISFVPRGGTSRQIGNATGQSLVLSPGDAVVVTYTVAPTMGKNPVSP